MCHTTKSLRKATMRRSELESKCCTLKIETLKIKLNIRSKIITVKGFINKKGKLFTLI